MSTLNGFGNAILRIEAERMEEARRAIEAGWTPESHPDTCCPEPVRVPVPRPAPDPGYAAVRRRSAEARVSRLKERLAGLEQTGHPARRADAGEINVPFHRRERATNAAISRGVQEADLRAKLAHAESRIRYWAEREAAVSGPDRGAGAGR
ncbi:hypothetical protein [Arthrobacter sp. zg-Y1110]|uniref:hypothetical protein n=1 Tax=Arthrobacter sp. zg-Y1110 TaxID=2886932 RepID=UPI001D1396EF|nr:hypothetical protein [Arthrobacter sp. zg-Y1110]MCC3292970.1 hypothetical protein [Arthrobacter sp. zg-Y1110]UWX86909.1 hypothetical protein N2K99_18875 [Arthrobacter sp. zg-Y1110]